MATSTPKRSPRTINTPARALLRATIQSRASQSGGTVRLMDNVFKEMAELVSDRCSRVESRIILAESEHNRLEPFLEVAMKAKSYQPETGPLDAIRLIIDVSLHFRVYVYAELVEQGTLSSAEDIDKLMVLQRMNDERFFVCTGVKEYSLFKQSIGYDAKSVVHVALPNDTVRHVDCIRMGQKTAMQKTSLCKSCSSLKQHLTRQKRRHEESHSNHEEHKTASSKFPFDYLSPASKKARLTNIKKENHALKVKVKRFRDVRLELNDDQSKEMAELVHTISNSEAGKIELEKIFNEAEEVGEGRGYSLKNIWEEDVSDIETFNKDQLTNSKWHVY